MNTSKKLFLHAPNVHVGGGLSLLRALYALPELDVAVEQLDIRAQAWLTPVSANTYWVHPTFFSRLSAELRLRRQVDAKDVVLCFHGLVPLLPLRGEVTVFLQNRILLSPASLKTYPLKTRLRLWVERSMLKAFAHRVQKFVVQTPSMAAQARAFLGDLTPVVVCPFVIAQFNERRAVVADKRFDFIYVASAEPHKNHQKLLDAWCLLAQQGLRPELAVTVPFDSPIANRIEELKQTWGLNISNFGHVSPEQVAALYDQSNALIYPSLTESLGLPLIEAQSRHLPIVAAELDYVRDVVEPAETFDPRSQTSIARAVNRFMGIKQVVQPMNGPEVFLREVLR